MEESELIEAGTDEPPPLKRLDGEVTRKGQLASAGGTYCETWVGKWEKGGGEVGGKKANGEKVSQGFYNFYLTDTALYR